MLSRADEETLNHHPCEPTRRACSWPASTPTMASRPPSSEPQPPNELRAVLTAGECVLFAGSGLSARSGYPLWHEVVRRLSAWALEKGLISEDIAVSNRLAIDRGQAGPVADGIVASAGESSVDLIEFVRSMALPQLEPSDAHVALGALPFAAALTTNVDDLLDRTFAARQPRVLVPADSDEAMEQLHKLQFFLFKLYGDAARHQSVILAPSQFEDTARQNIIFAQFLESVCLSRSLLFVGAGVDIIAQYFRAMGTMPRATRRHYALLALDNPEARSAAFALEKRYNLTCIWYDDPRHGAVARFLRRLSAGVQKASPATRPAATESRLNKVVLEGVGPFARMELPIDRRWNILLGDNGVGKSTILKAIATAIAGADARDFAQRFLRPRQTAASITLETNRGTYSTQIFASPSGGAEVRTSGRLSDAEGWLILAFPALRTVGWDRPKAPEQLVRRRPTSNDVVPLVRGGIDPRLDRLKQWIVNLDYLSKDAALRGERDSTYGRLIDHFFAVTSELVAGVHIRKGAVRADTLEVIVDTDDGPVPIEALSQGTTSLMGWVGIVLQRLYEVYGMEDDPTRQYALILIDELDAHLHPAWQQGLPARLSQIFPTAQFIATTHSPLIVGGLPADQVILLERNKDGIVERVPVEAEMTMGRADQVLTGNLFGLISTLDIETQEKLNEYTHLLGISRRTSDEEVRFRAIGLDLESRIPGAGETMAERVAVRRLEESVRQLTRDPA
jgi:hypothetical protein